MQTAKMVSTTDVQNNFGKYLQYAIDHGQVVITRNGKRVARIVSETESVQYLTDSLRGILKAPYSDEDVKAARVEKYTP